MAAHPRTRRSLRRGAALVPLIVGALAVPLLVSGCTTQPSEPSASEPTVSTPSTPTPEPVEPEVAPTVEPYGAQGALAATDLTLEQMLAFAVQDEYIARLEYQEIMAAFDVQAPYANIMRSEESHLELLRGIYATRGEEFPADTAAEHLVVPTSLLEAAQKGVQAEIDNIDMYDRFLTYDLPADVVTVFTELRNGSVNHLNAFEAQVNRLS